MESKKFYLVVGYVLPVLLIVMLMAPVARLGKYVLMTECAYFLILSVLTYLLWRYSEYRLMSYVVCFVTCFLIFPMFFFVTGYIYNGVPIFLASTVVLTFFLIGGKSVWIVVSLELVYYCAIFVYCCYNTEKLNYYMDTNCSFVEKVINFLFACLVPILIVSYQTALSLSGLNSIPYWGCIADTFSLPRRGPSPLSIGLRSIFSGVSWRLHIQRLFSILAPYSTELKR